MMLQEGGMEIELLVKFIRKLAKGLDLDMLS